MDEIMVNLFRTQYNLVMEKMQAINELPRRGLKGHHFSRLHITQYDCNYITSDHTWGDDSEYILTVGWDEINNDLEYFAEKFRREDEEAEKRLQAKIKEGADKILAKEQEDRYKNYTGSIDPANGNIIITSTPRMTTDNRFFDKELADKLIKSATDSLKRLPPMLKMKANERENNDPSTWQF